jgi:hypothetical protein
VTEARAAEFMSRIGWWKCEGFIHAVMMTGHDANCLQVLRLAVAEATAES